MAASLTEDRSDASPGAGASAEDPLDVGAANIHQAAAIARVATITEAQARLITFAGAAFGQSAQGVYVAKVKKYLKRFLNLFQAFLDCQLTSQNTAAGVPPPAVVSQFERL